MKWNGPLQPSAEVPQGIHDKALERIRTAHEAEHAEVVRAHEAALAAVRADRDLAVRAAVDCDRLGGFSNAQLGIFS